MHNSHLTVSLRRIVVTLVAMLALALAAAPAAAAPPNLVANGGFALPGSGPTQTTVVGIADPTAAPSWLVWNNDQVTTTTELVPSGLPNHGGQMLHVSVVCEGGVTGSGIYQQFAAVDDGPGSARAAVWLYVVSGQVGVGTGNGGETGIDGATEMTGRWELVRARSSGSPANEVIIYALNGPAEFYVGNVVVQTRG